MEKTDTKVSISKKECHLPIKLQTYSLELKAQAVRMAVEDDLGITETAKRLSIQDSMLSGWVGKISKTPNAPAPGEQIVQAAEVKRLEKENNRLRMELEILKKAAAYFAGESLQSTLKVLSCDRTIRCDCSVRA